MQNTQTDPGHTAAEGRRETCDLCVIGAGMAGLNALFVASEYLPTGARVILIDRNPGCGGMWGETYDYVRLHQPHPMFTIGDAPWNWSRPAGYLATGAEVLDHMKQCLADLRTRVDLLELYGHSLEGYEEIPQNNSAEVRITCRSVADDGARLVIKAQRMINAAGYAISALEPLKLTSDEVISTTPQRLVQDDPGGAKPAYVIGGGKTGMDTVLALLARNYRRKITLMRGRGTVFAHRDHLFPPGRSRLWRGTQMMSVLRDMATTFDGTNEDAVFDHFHRRYAISPDGEGEQFLYALMSQDESARIATGTDQIVGDYLEDVVTSPDGPQISLRSGKRMAAKPGSIFINCTGHALRDSRPYQPYISKHGAILTVTPRSAVHFLTTVASYFLTHLFFLGKAREVPLYALDMHGLFRHNRKAWFAATTTQALLNTILLMNSVPYSVLERCGLDLDRWYPLARRAPGLIWIKMNQRRYIAHCRQSLDRVRDRSGTEGGVISNQ